MAIITLLSDWKSNDYYSAVIKACVLSQNIDIQIVEIAQNLPTFDIVQAAFILRSSLPHFPKGTVHLLAIRSVKEDNAPLIIAQWKGQYIIGNDTGIFSLITQEYEQILNVEYKSNSSFPEKDIFIPLALKLLEGQELLSLGQINHQIILYRNIQATIEENQITGTVIYKDSYGNAFVNIDKELFYTHQKNRRFEILLNSFHHKTNTIHQSYHEVEKRELFSIFNSLDLLEIGMRQANACEVLNIQLYSNIIVRFLEH